MAFLDRAFLELAVDSINADPEALAALDGWTFEVGLVADRPQGPLGLVVRALREGRMPPAELVDPGELAARPPPYFARATAEDFRALLLGSLDPIAAIVQRRLVAIGDLSPLIDRLRYRGVLERWLAVLRGAA